MDFADSLQQMGHVSWALHSRRVQEAASALLGYLGLEAGKRAGLRFMFQQFIKSRF